MPLAVTPSSIREKALSFVWMRRMVRGREIRLRKSSTQKSEPDSTSTPMLDSQGRNFLRPWGTERRLTNYTAGCCTLKG